jgi:recombination protein RecT
MSTEIARRPPMHDIVERVSSDDFKEQIAKALPENVKPERFARIAITALLQSGEQLAKCEPNSVYRALLRAAQDGLMPDGKEAALVAYNTKVKGENGQPDRWETRAQYLAMVGGLRKVLGEHGWMLTSAVIKESDEFEYELGETPRIIVHRPPRPGMPRGEVVGAYAQAKHADGRVLVEIMDLAEINKVRAASRSADRGPWKDWFERMAEKTPAKRLALKVPLGELDPRSTRILAAADTDPSEASRLIYGGEVRTETPALPLASAGAEDPPAGTDGGQQAAAEVVAADAAAAAPGPDDELDGEPGPDEPEQHSAFQAPPVTDDDPVVFAAKFASQIVVPIGQWRGKSLAEVHEAGAKGVQWFKYALANFDDSTGTTDKATPQMRPGELVQAIAAFAKVYLPDEYQAAAAAKLAS